MRKSCASEVEAEVTVESGRAALLGAHLFGVEMAKIWNQHTGDRMLVAGVIVTNNVKILDQLPTSSVESRRIEREDGKKF